MTRYEQLLAGLSLAATFCILIWLLYYSSYGIEFTDEGFYLNSISNPFLYSASLMQFGFVYHPLYLLLDGSLVALRQANILITFMLACIMTIIFFRTNVLTSKMAFWQEVAIASGFACLSLVIFLTWRITPSYYSLALQAICITISGWFLASKEMHRTSITGWVLIGVGGCLLFLAKPSSAAGFALASLIYLMVAGKFSIRMAAIGGAACITALIASAWLISGSLPAFVMRVQDGIELVQIMDHRYNFLNTFRIDAFSIQQHTIFAILIIMIMTFLSVIALQAKRYILNRLGGAIAVAFFVYVLLVISGYKNVPFVLENFRGMVIFSILLAAILIACVLYYKQRRVSFQAAHWVIFPLFLITPYLYYYGSNVNFWENSVGAGMFWALSGIALLIPFTKNMCLTVPLPVFALASQAVTCMLIVGGMMHPYRQPAPIPTYNTPFLLGASQSRLILASSYADYLSTAVNKSKEAGFIKGTPVIDLTGQSPTILYAMEASAIGAPWMLSWGNASTYNHAVAALQKVPCESLASAWLLIEPEGPRRISLDILHGFGSGRENYQMVAHWKAAPGAGGWWHERNQYLLKPLRGVSEASAACQHIRQYEGDENDK